RAGRKGAARTRAGRASWVRRSPPYAGPAAYRDGCRRSRLPGGTDANRRSRSWRSGPTPGLAPLVVTGEPAEWVRERANDLNPQRAIGQRLAASGGGDLAEARAILPHREELVAERVSAEGIAARAEQQRPGDLVAR